MTGTLSQRWLSAESRSGGNPRFDRVLARRVELLGKLDDRFFTRGYVGRLDAAR